MIEFLRNLIQTRSLSGKENGVAELVSREMKKLGYVVEMDEMGSIVGRRGREGGKTILFDAHMDHIGEGSPESWTHEPYKAEVVNGKMYGRGTVDMKGSLAAMLYGCAAPDLKGRIYVTCVVHEETSEGVATRKIIEDRGLKIDACVLGEPTDLKLSIGQRGRCVLRVTTTGVISHASMPELGVNALYKMMPVIERIRGENEHMPHDAFLGTGSMAITSISASPGAGPIVPDRCEILVDRRLVPGESLEGVLQQMDMLLLDANVELVEDELLCYTGLKTRVKQYFPGWITDANHWVVKQSLEALGDALGRQPDIVGWKFSTDGVATAGELSIPTLGFGPGDPSLAHQPDEHIFLSDVVSAAQGFSNLSYRLSE